MKILPEMMFAAFMAWGSLWMTPRSSKRTTETINAMVKAPLLQTRWQLVELEGKSLPDSATNKPIYILLKKDDSRVEGNGGCNAFSGNYKIDKNNQISFSEVVSTKMLCPGIDYETRFFVALSSADHYRLQGDTLSLLKGTGLILARFEAVKK